MEWTIPGTVLTGSREDVAGSIRQIEGMFLGGGMIRSQLASVSGVEPHDIQNWVKRGFLSSPVNKRYSLNQFCRIVTINMLRSALPMDKICSLLTYVSGRLDDESDDLIDDKTLYFAFLEVAAQFRGLAEDREALHQCIEERLADYREPYPGAKDRVVQALTVMIIAWVSSLLRAMAEKRLREMQP